MDPVVKGAKKILSLTNTKIRLAENFGTICTKPAPLPLVKLFSEKEIKTVKDAKEHLEYLRKNLDVNDKGNIAKTVIQAIDIIEGVKYQFEEISCPDVMKFRELEQSAIENSSAVNLLLMTEHNLEGISMFVGGNAPTDCILLGEVPSSISIFLRYAYGSEYFSHGKELKNINAVLGHFTLILNAIHFSLGALGARLLYEKTGNDIF